MPWDIITEPAKKNTLYIDDVTVGGVSQDYTTVVLTINDITYTGSSVEIKFSDTGSFSSYVTVTFLAALYSLYEVEQSAGEALYGAKYVSMATLTAYHLNGAGRTDCDHWHDGGGIITHHAAFTLQCEQSLQSIDPTIAMPYWEYPKDGEMYTDYTWVTSDVFASDWFGAAAPQNDDHAITSGLWSYMDMPDGSDYTDWSIADEGSLNPYINAYGVMRTPWNNNAVTSIGRYNFTYGSFVSDNLGRPTCSTMSDCYNSSTLSDVTPPSLRHTSTHFPHVFVCVVLNFIDVTFPM